MIDWADEAKRVAGGIRRRVLEHTLNQGGGYLSQACSSAETLAVLYTKSMNLGPVHEPILPRPFPGVPGPDNPRYFTGAEFNGPHSPQYDRFILSPSHYALALYACLIEVKRMHPDGLKQFNKDGSSVEMIGAEHSPGMEVTNGSLGQAASQAAGIALARKMKKEPGRVFIYMSDGEFQIGQTWEAVQFMAHHKLDNVAIFVDVNGCQCDGRVEDRMNIEPLDERLKAFNCDVVKINGHFAGAIDSASRMQHPGKPLIVLCSTLPYQGIPTLKNNSPKFHYLRIKNSQEKELYEQELEKLSGQAG